MLHSFKLVMFAFYEGRKGGWGYHSFHGPFVIKLYCCSFLKTYRAMLCVCMYNYNNNNNRR